MIRSGAATPDPYYISDARFDLPEASTYSPGRATSACVSTAIDSDQYSADMVSEPGKPGLLWGETIGKQHCTSPSSGGAAA